MKRRLNRNQIRVGVTVAGENIFIHGLAGASGSHHLTPRSTPEQMLLRQVNGRKYYVHFAFRGAVFKEPSHILIVDDRGTIRASRKFRRERTVVIYHLPQR